MPAEDTKPSHRPTNCPECHREITRADNLAGHLKRIHQIVEREDPLADGSLLPPPVDKTTPREAEAEANIEKAKGRFLNELTAIPDADLPKTILGFGVFGEPHPTVPQLKAQLEADRAGFLGSVAYLRARNYAGVSECTLADHATEKRADYWRVVGQHQEEHVVRRITDMDGPVGTTYTKRHDLTSPAHHLLHRALGIPEPPPGKVWQHYSGHRHVPAPQYVIYESRPERPGPVSRAEFDALKAQLEALKEGRV